MDRKLPELARSTRGYSKRNLIGRGGFGAVYKGRVRDSLDVAVKVLTHVRQQA